MTTDWSKPMYQGRRCGTASRLPPRELVPKTYRRQYRSNRLCRLAVRMLQGSDDLQMTWNGKPFIEWRDGIDPTAAHAHLRNMWLYSGYQSDPERIAAAGWLLSLWTQPVKARGT